MTTASPRASRAPLSSRRRCTAIMVQQQGVRAQPLTDGLERDDVLGRHVAHVHVGSEVLDEPHLLGLARRLEDDPAGPPPPPPLTPPPHPHPPARLPPAPPPPPATLPTPPPTTHPH